MALNLYPPFFPHISTLYGGERFLPHNEEERQAAILKLKEKYKPTLSDYARFRAEYPYTLAKATQILARRANAKPAKKRPPSEPVAVVMEQPKRRRITPTLITEPEIEELVIKKPKGVKHGSLKTSWTRRIIPSMMLQRKQRKRVAPRISLEEQELRENEKLLRKMRQGEKMSKQEQLRVQKFIKDHGIRSYDDAYHSWKKRLGKNAGKKLTEVEASEFDAVQKLFRKKSPVDQFRDTMDELHSIIRRRQQPALQNPK